MDGLRTIPALANDDDVAAKQRLIVEKTSRNAALNCHAAAPKLNGLKREGGNNPERTPRVRAPLRMS